MQQVRLVCLALLLSAGLPLTLWAQGMLEVPPPPHSVQSGIGFLAGWFCNLPDTDGITVRYDGGPPNAVVYGVDRQDTVEPCGDADNGYLAQINWNVLGEGLHTVEVFAGDERFGSAEVWVTTLGEEFLRDVTAACVVEDFPQVGVRTSLAWHQSVQNFVIEAVDGPPPGTFTGRWEGMTAQGLSMGLTVSEANRITQVDFDYQQLGEIPPDPTCRHAVSVALSAVIGVGGTFSVAVSVPPDAEASGDTRIVLFDGMLSGSFSDSQGTGQWDFTRTILSCQRTPSSLSNNGCGGVFPFNASCEGYAFSFSLSRVE